MNDKIAKIILIMVLGVTVTSCLTSSDGNEDVSGFLIGSSLPISHKESISYQQELIRCHKTGGTRIVKLNSKLRCF